MKICGEKSAGEIISLESLKIARNKIKRIDGTWQRPDM